MRVPHFLPHRWHHLTVTYKLHHLTVSLPYKRQKGADESLLWDTNPTLKDVGLMTLQTPKSPPLIIFHLGCEDVDLCI